MGRPFLLLAAIATAIVVTTAPAHAETSGSKTNDPAPKAKVTKKTDDSKPVAKQPTTYTVAEGDYLELIGQNLGIEWVKIWQKNPQLQNQDVVHVGDVLTIPDKDEKLEDRALAQSAAPAPVAAVLTPNTVQNNVAATSSPRPYVGGPNAYAPGYCTWYVKTKRPDIGSYWGNANQWIASAQQAGYATGSEPRPGAIGVSFAGGYGHVVYVESVSGGSLTISDMNGVAGFGAVGYRSASASEFQYIY